MFGSPTRSGPNQAEEGGQQQPDLCPPHGQPPADRRDQGAAAMTRRGTPGGGTVAPPGNRPVSRANLGADVLFGIYFFFFFVLDSSRESILKRNV